MVIQGEDVVDLEGSIFITFDGENEYTVWEEGYNEGGESSVYEFRFIF